MTDRYDVAVIGAGHNGLICAAYLARAGLSVALIEARSEVGGCASTVDALGARVNICNCDHLWIRSTSVPDELELERHGLRYLDLDPSYVSLGWYGERPWALYRDPETTLAGLADSHPTQVRGYRRYLDEAVPVARALLAATNRSPDGIGPAAEIGRRSPRVILRLLRWSRRSALDVLGRYFDHDELIRPAMTVGPAVWGLPPQAPGTGLAAVGYAVKHLVPVGRPIGGSGALTDAVHAAFRESGGHTLLDAHVDRIVLGASGVDRVVMTRGDELAAQRVVAASDPRHLWLHWMRSRSDLPEVERAKAAPAPIGYESKLDLRMSRAPRYPALEDLTAADAAAADATLLVSPPSAEMTEAHARMAEGLVAERPMFITNTPSTLDPTMRAGEDHITSLEVLWTPSDRPGGWGASTEPDRWLELWQTVAPGASDDIVAHRVMTPDRYEREFHLPSGHAASYSGSPIASVLGRPRDRARHRTSLEGLYTSGAATYPGAGIWGAPGRNTALAILRDIAHTS